MDDRWLEIQRLREIDFNLIKPHIPRLIEILKEKSIVRRIAFDILLEISERNPEVLLDYVEDLKGLFGCGYESVYSSLLLSNLALRYPDVVDREIVENIFGMLEFEEFRRYAMLSLSKICIVKPEELTNYIPRLIELIKDGDFHVRWNSAKILLNLLSKNPEYIDEIVKIAENRNLKPSVRVVAYVIVGFFRAQSNPST